MALIWPPSGMALAAMLLFGYRLWPGLAVGALLTTAAANAPLGLAVGTAIGYPLEALVGAYLLRRLVEFQNSLARLRDVLGLTLLAGLLSTTIGATCGVVSLWLTG